MKGLCYKDNDIRDPLWYDDEALTVTSLNERPTILLSMDMFGGRVPAQGGWLLPIRPVLRHLDRREILDSLLTTFRKWALVLALFFAITSAPSLCPADPRATRNESLGQKRWSWRYGAD